MGFGKSLKKAFKKTTKVIKKGWKEALGWADDAWMKDYVLPAAAAAVGAYAGGPMGAIAAASVVQGGRTMHMQAKADKQQLAIANQQAAAAAAAAAVPVGTSVAAQQAVNAETADINYATERRRAMSTADTTLSSARLQRWAKNGKRKTL